MNRQIPLWVHVIQCHLDDLPDTVFVDFVHAERLDAIFLQDAFFARVNIAQTDVDNAVGSEGGLDPCEFGDFGADAEEEGDGHAVDVSYDV